MPMTRLLTSFLLMLALPLGLGWGEEPSEPPTKVSVVLEELLNDCVKAGGFRQATDPKTGKVRRDSKIGTIRLELADPAKVRAPVAAKHALLTSGLRNALVVLWNDVDWEEAPVIVSLLQSIGEETKDDRSLAFAAYFTAEGEIHDGKYEAALKPLEQAVGLFHGLQDSTWEARCLHRSGRLHEGLGDHGKALKAYLAALQAWADASGDHRQERAETLAQLGVVHLRQADVPRALDHLQRALSLLREVHGKKAHPSLAIVLNNIGYAHTEQAHYGQALDAYQDALAVLRELYPNRPHSEVAACLGNIGIIHYRRREYTKALDCYQQALAMQEKVYKKPHRDLAITRQNLGEVYHEQGQFEEALDQFRQSLAILEPLAGGRPDEGLANVLNSLTTLYNSLGDYDRSLAYGQRSLRMSLELFGDHHPAAARTWNNLALSYLQQAEYSKAMDCCLRAKEALEKSGNREHPEMATVWNSLGNVYHSRGERQRALYCYRKGLAIGEKVESSAEPDVAHLLNNIASIHDEEKEHALALDNYRRARNLLEKSRGPRHPEVATVVNNMGVVYSGQGDRDRAAEAFREAAAIRRQAYGNRHPHLAAAYLNLAVAHRDGQQYHQALTALEDALNALRRDPGDEQRAADQLATEDLQPVPETILTLGERAVTLEQACGDQPTADRLGECARAYDRAITALERQRRLVVKTEESQVLLTEITLEIFPHQIGVCQRLFQAEGKATYLHTAFQTAEQGTARAFLEALGKSRAQALGGVPAELRARETKLLAELRHLDDRIRREQSKPLDQRDPRRVVQLMAQRDQTEREQSDLLMRLEQDEPRYAALHYPRPCSVAEARECLGRDEVALLFVPGREASYVVLLEGVPARVDGSDGLAVHRLPAEKVIEEQVAPLVDPETLRLPARVRSLGARAYGLLLAPLAARIQGKDLVIVPGGLLCELPFELLVEGVASGGGKFLVENHRIRYAPSLTVLRLIRAWEKQRAQPDLPLWALGDPVYEAGDDRVAGRKDVSAASREALREYLSRTERGGSSVAYRRLPFSGVEVEAVRDVLGVPVDQVLTGPYASEALVKAASAQGRLARCRYVHFAAHGILGLDEGRQPSLVLSLVGNTGEDGFLQMDEVLDLKLNADLVVLSACQSGQGRLHNGEGVRGLARAFLYAGSRGVLCSLWSVADEETSRLMTDVYRSLKGGRPAPDALREAQLAAIRSGKAPYHWAPFILIGE
jgi:CHAT domain-containing protein/tetratricopeptide (TPR) repeat protein